MLLMLPEESVSAFRLAMLRFMARLTSRIGPIMSPIHAISGNADQRGGPAGNR